MQGWRTTPYSLTGWLVVPRIKIGRRVEDWLKAEELVRKEMNETR